MGWIEGLEGDIKVPAVQIMVTGSPVIFSNGTQIIPNSELPPPAKLSRIRQDMLVDHPQFNKSENGYTTVQDGVPR